MDYPKPTRNALAPLLGGEDSCLAAFGVYAQCIFFHFASINPKQCKATFFKYITIIRSSTFNLGTQRPCGLLDLAMYHRLIAPKSPRSLRIVLLVVLGPHFSLARVSLSPRSLFRIV